MPRIRTIKPEFFTSLTVADLTPEQRLTFIGLWTHVDDEGRCVDDPRLIKAALWPLDDRTAADVEIDIKALGAADLITRYVCRGKRYLAVTNWHEHQKINRPSDSKLPAPEEGEPLPPEPPASRRAHGGLTEGSNQGLCASHDGSQMGTADASRDGTANRAGTSGSDPDLWAADDHLTSSDAGFTEDSMNAHAHLSEDSPQERKGKEGNREGKGNPPTPRGSSGRPAVVQTGERAIEDRMTDAFMQSYRRGNSYRPRQVRQTIADAIANDTDPDELWNALELLGKNSSPVSANSLQFAFSKIRKASQEANVYDLSSGQPLTGTDATVNGWAAVADSFAPEHSEDSA